MGDFEKYLATLRERLAVEPFEAREIIKEIEAHLKDKAADLEAQGMDGATARTFAMQHMGDPFDISRRMRRV